METVQESWNNGVVIAIDDEKVIQCFSDDPVINPFTYNDVSETPRNLLIALLLKFLTQS